MHHPASRVVQLSVCAVTMGCMAVSSAAADSLAFQVAETDPVDLRSEVLTDDRISFGAMDGGREVMFNIYGGFAHQFRTNIDRGGEFSSSRVDASISAMTSITPDFDVRFAFGYEFDRYRFRGNTGIAQTLGADGPQPWEDIHTFGFGIIFGADMSNDWRIFGGPVFQFSGESGASFSDAFIAGGFIGTSFDLSPELTLGGGVGVVTQIERSVRIFPVLIVNWEITDQLKLTTETRASASGDTSLELVYDWGGGFETAIGGMYRFRRFRLDDNPSALVPDGVGQHSSFPFWLRLTYHFNPSFSLNVHGGAVLAGHLRLMNSGGGRIGREDYDPAGLVGVSASIRF